MLEKDSLESLKIDNSKLSEHKPLHIKSVRIRIYLDPKEKQKAKMNKNKVDVRIDVDKIKRQVFGKNQQSTNNSSLTNNQQSGLRSKKPIQEHQLDYKPLSPAKKSNKKKELLSPIRIVSRDDTMINQLDICGDQQNSDEEFIATVERTNKVAEGNKTLQSERLMRHGTFTVENCGDRIFLLPVIYSESYTQREVLTNLDGLNDHGDFWRFWVSIPLNPEFGGHI